MSVKGCNVYQSKIQASKAAMCIALGHGYPFRTGLLIPTAVKVNKGGYVMKHIKTLSTRDLKKSMKKGGCGECQTSCQSACKTSCTVGNQSCEQVK